MSIYFIPSEEDYNAKRTDKDKPWQEVYGRYICTVCHQHYKAGDAYTPDNHGGFRHVVCGGVV